MPPRHTRLLLSAWLTLASVLATPCLIPAAEAEQRPDAPAPARVDCCGDPLPEGAVARLGTVRLRHKKAVPLLAFAPDGKMLLSGSYDDSVRLWDLASGREVRTFRFPTGWVGAAAISPDGSKLAAFAKGRVDARGQALPHELRLWETASGREVGRLELEQMWCLAFSPDGRTLAVGGGSVHDGCVRLWDVATGRTRATFRHPAWVWRLAFSPHSNRLAWAGRGCKWIGVGDVVTGREVGRLEGYQGLLPLCLVFSSDGRALAAAGEDGEVVVWDGAILRLRHQLRSPEGCRGIAFSPDGRTLVGLDGTLGHSFLLWDVATGKQVRAVPAEDYEDIRPVDKWGIAFTPGGRVVALTVRQGASAAATWDATTGKPLARVRTLSRIEKAILSADARVLALATTDGVIGVYDATTGRELIRPVGHEGQIRGLIFSPDGRRLATVDAGGARLWEEATGREVQSFPRKYGGLDNVAFTPDGRRLAWADGVIWLWDAATGKERILLWDDEHASSSHYLAAVSADGRTLVAADWDGQCAVWDLTSGRLCRGFRIEGWTGVVPVAFSPDGRFLAGADDDCLRLWDVRAGRELPRVEDTEHPPRVFAFGQSGRTLVTADHPGRTLRLRDTVAGKVLAQFEGREQNQGALACSADGRLVAAWEEEGVIRVYETASGGMRCQFAGLGPLAFAPDGRSLACAETPTTGLIWDLTGLGPGVSGGATRLADAEVEALWADLAADDAGRAHRAVWRLAAASGAAASRIGASLRPVSAADPRLAALVRDLDSDNYAVREKAARALGEEVWMAEAVLRRALAGHPSAEVRRRAGDLLGRMRGTVSTPGVLRVLRAVEVLEHTGTAEARRLLEALAAGAAEARLTQEAQASLERLGKRRGK
jgi:WD40 repeat protein